MTAVVAGLAIMAVSPFAGVQAFGVILALCGGAWLWVQRAEADA